MEVDAIDLSSEDGTEGQNKSKNDGEVGEVVVNGEMAVVDKAEESEEAPTAKLGGENKRELKKKIIMKEY